MERDIGRRFDILIIRLLLQASVEEWKGLVLGLKKSPVVKSKYGVKLLQTEPKFNDMLTH